VISIRRLPGNAASQQGQNQYQARHNDSARSCECAHRVSPFSYLFASVPSTLYKDALLAIVNHYPFLPIFFFSPVL
jgi:hypothetical protein